MACKHCSAALPSSSNVCRFCAGIHDPFSEVECRVSEGGGSTRLCPRCEIKLVAVDLGLHGRFIVERCRACRGHFFDQGELHTLIMSPSPAAERPSRIAELLQHEPVREAREAGYVKCPVCAQLMNRENYGERFGKSFGVPADICPMHGMWLDGGEISAVLHWAQSLRPQANDVHLFEEFKETIEGTSTTRRVVRVTAGGEGKTFADLAGSAQFGEEVDALFTEALARMFGLLL